MSSWCKRDLIEQYDLLKSESMCALGACIDGLFRSHGSDIQ